MRSIIVVLGVALSVAAALLLRRNQAEGATVVLPLEPSGEAAHAHSPALDDELGWSSRPSARGHAPSKAARHPLAPNTPRPSVSLGTQAPIAAPLEQALREGTSVSVAFDMLLARWEAEDESDDSTRNSLAIADSFLTEVGLPPESVEHLECRDTLCKVDLKSDLPPDQLLALKRELEESGIPVSADFKFGEDGQLRVEKAFFPRAGFEQKMVAPAPQATASGRALDAARKEGP